MSWHQKKRPDAQASAVQPQAPSSAKMYVWAHRKDWKRYQKGFSSQVTGTVCTSGKYYLEETACGFANFCKRMQKPKTIGTAQLEAQANLRRELHRPVYPNDGRCFCFFDPRPTMRY